MDRSLTLPQAFALLLIAPDGRRATDGQTFDIGLGGAVLADLALRGSVSLADKRVTVTNGAPTGDAVLDDALGSIAASGKPRAAKTWVTNLGRRPLRDAVTASLVDAGLLDEEQRTRLGIFTSTRYPEKDGAPEAALRRELGDVLIGAATPTTSSATLIGLLDATKTLHKQFELIDRRLVKQITAGEGDWASPAVKAVLEQIQAAAMVAIIAGTTAASGAVAGS
jgi:hypothetical protein